MIRTMLMGLLRVLCYLGLAFVLSGLLAWMAAQGHCPRFDTGAIRCDGAQFHALAEWAMSVILLSAFTGVPLLLALGGLVFALIDGRRWWRRRRA